MIETVDKQIEDIIALREVITCSLLIGDRGTDDDLATAILAARDFSADLIGENVRYVVLVAKRLVKLERALFAGKDERDIPVRKHRFHSF